MSPRWLLLLTPLYLASCGRCGMIDDSGPVDDTAAPAPPCDPEGDDLDPDVLAGTLDWIDANPTHIDSLQVHHCGELRIEAYFNGYDADALHDLQSATKTWSAVLIGIGIDQGWIEGVEQPLAELLPDHAHLLEGEKADITLEHLLTMTSGLAWQDFGLANSFERIAVADDSVAFVLGEPLETSPGEVFHYNTGSSHLLSAIVHHNAGMSTADFAQRWLFDPLGIPAPVWPALRDGVNQGGWGMEMRPSDFAKLGQMMLDEGRWQGEPLLGEGFVHAATTPWVLTDHGGWYGYQMWIETNLFEVDDIAGARGYGGQDCFVLEQLDMVVTFTGDIAYPSEMAEDVVTLMNEHILPAHVGAP